MRVIWKFPLKIVDVQSINMPAGAEILTVQFQDETLCLWAMVNIFFLATTHHSDRVIEIYSTGNPGLDGHVSRKYIGTVQQDRFVWHVFEVL